LVQIVLRRYVTATVHATGLAQQLAQAAAGKLGRDIVALDVSAPLAITDVFLLVSAANERQVGAIVDAIDEAAVQLRQPILRREGENEGHWVLLDLNDVVVHVMLATDRANYSLERIWKDAPKVPLDLDDGGDS